MRNLSSKLWGWFILIERYRKAFLYLYLIFLLSPAIIHAFSSSAGIQDKLNDIGASFIWLFIGIIISLVMAMVRGSKHRFPMYLFFYFFTLALVFGIVFDFKGWLFNFDPAMYWAGGFNLLIIWLSKYYYKDDKSDVNASIT